MGTRTILPIPDPVRLTDKISIQKKQIKELKQSLRIHRLALDFANEDIWTLRPNAITRYDYALVWLLYAKQKLNQKKVKK